MEIKVKIWIEDNKQNLIFGSGKTEILKEIEKTGSISDASKNLNMNYKKTWSHIKILEDKDIKEYSKKRFNELFLSEDLIKIKDK